MPAPSGTFRVVLGVKDTLASLGAARPGRLRALLPMPSVTGMDGSAGSRTASDAIGDPSMNEEGTGPAVILDHHRPVFFVDRFTINEPS